VAAALGMRALVLRLTGERRAATIAGCFYALTSIAPAPGRESPGHARAADFDLHGGRTVRAEDRHGLERLCHYLLRPPLAQARLELLPDAASASRSPTSGPTAPAPSSSARSSFSRNSPC
jgi:hypothetical protein